MWYTVCLQKECADCNQSTYLRESDKYAQWSDSLSRCEFNSTVQSFQTHIHSLCVMIRGLIQDNDTSRTSGGGKDILNYKWMAG